MISQLGEVGSFIGQGKAVALTIKETSVSEVT